MENIRTKQSKYSGHIKIQYNNENYTWGENLKEKSKKLTTTQTDRQYKKNGVEWAWLGTLWNQITDQVGKPLHAYLPWGEWEHDDDESAVLWNGSMNLFFFFWPTVTHTVYFTKYISVSS